MIELAMAGGIWSHLENEMILMVMQIGRNLSNAYAMGANYS